MIEFPSAESFTNMLQDVSDPLVALLSRQPVERQAEVWQAISDAAMEYATADGGLRMSNTELCKHASQSR